MRAHGLFVLLVLGACGDAAKDAEPSSRPSAPTASTAASSEPLTPPAKQGTEISMLKTKTKEGGETSIAIKAPAGWTVLRAPDGPDPHEGKFTLAEATKGLDKQGTLSAHIDTSMGSIYCDLFEKGAPNTVANFVGLARGKRKFWDADKLEWTARPYYAGTEFHRVMSGFMIQGGDHTGTGKGGIGYTVADEIQAGDRADRPGLLFLANRGPNSGESQFFITTRVAPHIDGKFTNFGECAPVALIDRISRVPSADKPSFRPREPVSIRGIEVRRLAGGRSKWMPKGTDLSIPGAVPEGRAVQVPLEGPR